MSSPPVARQWNTTKRAECGEAPTLPIKHGDRPHDVAVDPGLLLHFLHDNLDGE